MKKTVALIAAVLACGLTWQAQAYLEPTHELLSLQAAARSNLLLDPTLLSDLGLAPWNAVDYVDSNGARRALQGMIAFGAVAEDSPSLRVLNHFFDPQFQNFTGRGLVLGGSPVGTPSPDWALEDRFEFSGAPDVPDQIQSFRHAYEQYFAMLTAPALADRRAAASRMFQMLGMVVHHIQDMAQPQHTRNEAHPPGSKASEYEKYTAENQKLIAAIAAGNFNSYNPIPAFPTARQYWHSVASQADRFPRYIGMAEFTAQNYVTLNSMFTLSPSGALGNHPAFPLPTGISADGTATRLVRLTQSIPLSDGTVKTGVMEHVVGNVFDGFLGTSTPRILASRSMLIALSGARLRALTVGEPVWDDNYQVLFPRAIAFSAGLINHFFRGRMNLRRDPGGAGWLIDNVGQQDLGGDFKVYFEDAAGTRGFTGGSTRTVIPPGQSARVNFTEPPQGTTRLIAVFAGQIGLEGDSTGQGFFATAGKVIPFSAQASSCGVPISSRGSSGTTNQVLTIGSSTQTVIANFEAYTIPDKLELFANGIRLAGTEGLVSGNHSFSFQFNPQALGTTQLLARVTGNNDPGTAWELCVACNNSTCGPSPAVLRDVTFGMTFAGNTGWVCTAGNVAVDGQSVGFLGSGFLRTKVKALPGTDRHVLSLPSAGCFCSNSIGGCSFGHGAQFSISYIDGLGQTKFVQVPLIQANGLSFEIK